MQAGYLGLDTATRDFYVRTLAILNESGVPYLVGGAYALTTHAGIERHTKDMDVFVRRADRDRVLAMLETAGYRTEIPFPHWLAKAHGDQHFVDVIYSSGNAIADVDDEWFEHSVEADLLGVPVRLCPAEEIIWSKAFVMERERFDGADIAHVIRTRGQALDWERLLRRFDAHWRVLFGHLIFFGFVYPAEREKVPSWVIRELSERLVGETRVAVPGEKVCHGTVISREQYLVDIGQWGYADGRLQPRGRMTPEEVTNWTAAITRK